MVEGGKASAGARGTGGAVCEDAMASELDGALVADADSDTSFTASPSCESGTTCIDTSCWLSWLECSGAGSKTGWRVLTCKAAFSSDDDAECHARTARETSCAEAIFHLVSCLKSTAIQRISSRR